MDTYGVTMVVLTNTGSTFVVTLPEVPATDPQQAGMKAIQYTLTTGVDVLAQIGLPMIHINPVGAIPFNIEKKNLVSLASSLRGLPV